LRRAAAVVLILLVFGPAGVRASTWYSGGDGLLRATCCCPVHPGHRSRPVPRSELRPACCCTILAVPARDAAVRDVAPPAADGAPVAMPAVMPAPPPAAVGQAALDRPGRTRGPPGRTDLFARHCALLL
jgi:hypothetical protein